MKITLTINLYCVLITYLCGSIFGLIVFYIISDKNKLKNSFKNKKHRVTILKGILLIITLSWINLCWIYLELRPKFLKWLKDKIPLYIYSIIYSYMNFKFKKYYILKNYFLFKWDNRKGRSILENKFEDIDYFYHDIYNNSWNSYKEMLQFYFIERYNK